MTRWLGLLLLCLMLAPVAHAAEPCRPTPNYQSILTRIPKTLMFEVRRCNYPVSHVFGTFHSDSPELKAAYQQATSRIQHSKVLALEIELDNFSRAEAQTKLLLPEGSKKLSEIVGKKTFSQIRKKLLKKLNISTTKAQRYKPWALAMLAQYPPMEGDGLVLDEKLQYYGQTWDLKIIGLETATSQLKIFDTMPHDLQMDFLQSTLDDAGELEAQHHELKAHYIAQDLPAIAAMSDRLLADMAKKYPDLAAYIEDRVLIRRNKEMTAKLNDLLKHSVFVAVGALHLPGDEGLLRLLEQRGYEIWPVTHEEAEEIPKTEE